ncbi:hypothetical protein TNIN_117291 [Trichonephila inaurata madagascariensis]|uniref:Uncharacterized protein n=1 Tax=Trichonephila inaurata madagascariensis TaxID=2747483 RepID=A0A8X6YW75_9ARAC|nr:hypothetical protein TNIN_117291 [Trichonephila inaurata madagascariensis]
MELAERRRKEMKIVERKKRVDFEQRMRNVKMKFELQKKPIELEGEGYFARAGPDIEGSIDAGNSENEVRCNLNSETRLKAEEEAKAVEEGWKKKE